MSYIIHPVKADISDVTASRSIGQAYTNNKGRPLLIILSVIHEVTVQNTFLLLQATTGVMINWSGWYNTPAVGIEMYGTIVLLVPAGSNYQVTENASGGVNTIIRWIETEL